MHLTVWAPKDVSEVVDSHSTWETSHRGSHYDGLVVGGIKNWAIYPSKEHLNQLSKQYFP